MKLLLKIQYIGSAYCGFQVQKNGVSVQETLCRAAEAAFGFPVNVTGCSRTDAGVHALGFTAALEPRDPARRGDAWSPVPAPRLHRVLNRLLPDDVSVIAAAVVPDSFHPRYDVLAKQYVYRIWDRPYRSPFLYGRAMELRGALPPDAAAVMAETAALYPGTRNFAGFMAVGSKITDPVRTVTETSVYRDAEGCLCFSVRADGFLYHMVRIMAGTLLDRAAGRLTESSVRRALAEADRSAAGFTAPPEGLYLKEVFYHEPIDWVCE